MSAPLISRPTAFEARIADRKDLRYQMTIGLDGQQQATFPVRPRKGAGLGKDAVSSNRSRGRLQEAGRPVAIAESFKYCSSSPSVVVP